MKKHPALPDRARASAPSANLLKFKLTIAYEGTAYAGWQVQRNGVGVQEKVEQALARIFPSVRRIHSSSRTDTGVHALGMVAHVQIPRAEFKMEVAKLPLAVNAHLPPDIRLVAAQRCRPNFHARFDATGKEYRYFVWNHRAMNPLLRRQAWHVPHVLNLPAMRAAARLFLGRQDFKSFATTREYEMESTVRTVTRCDIKRSGALLSFIIRGDGFLYRMCRGMVGTLVQVGRGRYGQTEIKRMLKARDRRAGGVTAPAQGLILWRVSYAKGEGQQKL